MGFFDWWKSNGDDQIDIEVVYKQGGRGKWWWGAESGGKRIAQSSPPGYDSLDAAKAAVKRIKGAEWIGERVVQSAAEDTIVAPTG